MKVEEAIRKRRSVKEFSTKQVNWEELTKVLEAAIYAPMAGNIFSLRFIVVSDKEKKNKIANACLEQYFIQDASFVVVVCNDLALTKDMYGEFAEKFGRQQAGAAIQNMLLTATSLGLASCWIGSFEEESIKRLLSIPDEVVVEAVIGLGNIKGKVEMPPKKDLNKVVYFENYGKPAGWKEMHPDFVAVREAGFEK